MDLDLDNSAGTVKTADPVTLSLRGQFVPFFASGGTDRDRRLSIPLRERNTAPLGHKTNALRNIRHEVPHAQNIEDYLSPCSHGVSTQETVQDTTMTSLDLFVKASSRVELNIHSFSDATRSPGLG